MRRSNSLPEVNAGSMADIAFLLLLFFLVTSAIPNDQGFNRKLPGECPPNVICSETVAERNVLHILINNSNHIMVNEKQVAITDIKELIKNFVDNNGDGSCSYCLGTQATDASDNPKEAVLSLQSAQQSSYDTFIKVQDEIAKAFYELRSDYSERVLHKKTEDLSPEDIDKIKKAYPFILSEAQLK